MKNDLMSFIKFSAICNRYIKKKYKHLFSINNYQFQDDSVNRSFICIKFIITLHIHFLFAFALAICHDADLYEIFVIFALFLLLPSQLFLHTYAATAFLVCYCL